MSNRSAPSGPVIPVIAYPDVEAAAEWLCAAFGFRIRLRIPGHRIQMHALGGSLVILEGEGAVSGFYVMIRVPDADAHYEKAKQNGAVASEPVDYPYGERQYSAQDPWGRKWTFTQTITDVDPATWGGVAIHPDVPDA